MCSVQGFGGLKESDSSLMKRLATHILTARLPRCRYIRRFESNNMTQEEMKNVGLPYSQVLVRGVEIWAMAVG